MFDKFLDGVMEGLALVFFIILLLSTLFLLYIPVYLAINFSLWWLSLDIIIFIPLIVGIWRCILS